MSPSLSRSRIAISSMFFLNGFTFASWATRIPAIQKQFDLSEGTLGMILASIAFGAILSMSSSAPLCRRFSSRAICTLSAIAFLLTLVAVPLTPNVALLGLAVFFMGVTHGLLDVSMNVQAVDIEKLYDRPIMSSIHACWSIGGLAGAIFGTVMTYCNQSVLVQFALNSGVGLLALSLFWHNMLGTIYKPVVTSTAKVSTSSAARWQVALLGAMAFCTMMGEGAMADWTAVFLSSEFNVGDSVAAVGYTVFAICMASCRLLGDWLTRVLGIMSQIRICGVLAMVGVVVAVVSNSPIQSIIGFGMIGAGFSTVVPILFTLSGRITSMSSSGALAAVSSIGYFGLLLGPPAIGLAAEVTSLRFSLMIVFLATAIGLALSVVLNRSSLVSTASSESELEESELEDIRTVELAGVSREANLEGQCLLKRVS